MSNCVPDQKIDQQNCRHPLHEQKAHKYIDEEEDISVTFDQKQEKEATTPLIRECSMPTAPSIIAQRHLHQQNNNNAIQNGHNAKGVVQNGHNANACGVQNGKSSISRRSAAAITMPTTTADAVDHQQQQQRQQITAATNGGTKMTKFLPSRKKGCCCTPRACCGDVKLPDVRCCCGLVRIRHVAIVLGVLEFVIFATQLIVSLVDLFGGADNELWPQSAASTLSTLLTIVSLILAIAAAMLLVSGVQFRSPYLLVPHILMQFAFMIASLVLIGYLFSWWYGGFKIRVSAIVFENSAKGYQGLHTAKDRAPIRGNLAVDEFNTIILLMILFCGLIFIVQLWLYHLIITLFRELLAQPKAVSSSLSPTNTDTVDSCTTVMMMSTVSSQCSPPNNSGNGAAFINGHHLQNAHNQHQFAHSPAEHHSDHHQQHII